MYDVIIIGAGPGGMTAGIYTQRANLKTMMIEKAAPGGYMVNTYEIENYPGVGKVKGYELSEKMFEHTQSLGVTYQYGDVNHVEVDGEIKKVHTADGKTYETRALVIASGTNPRMVEAKGADTFFSKGISFCAVCDGAFYKGKHVIVLGGGNSALDEAIYLTGMKVKVTIVNILNSLQADKSTVEKAKKNPNIDFLLGHEIIEFKGDQALQSVVLRDVDNQKTFEKKIDGVFVFIGQNPNTEFIKDLGITTEQGYIKAEADMRTSIPGVFAIGDVIDKKLRQIVTATSDGAIASQSIARYLENMEK